MFKTVFLIVAVGFHATSPPDVLPLIRTGNMDGAPVPVFEAEPQVATGKFTTALEVKPILNATRANWIGVREYGGQDLVYVTHLWSWRCGLVEMRIGLNGATPQPWPLPDCHMDLPVPNMIAESDGLPFRAFPLNSIHQIEVFVTYDDLTSQSATFDRQGVMIP